MYINGVAEARVLQIRNAREVREPLRPLQLRLPVAVGSPQQTVQEK